MTRVAKPVNYFIFIFKIFQNWTISWFFILNNMDLNLISSWNIYTIFVIIQCFYTFKKWTTFRNNFGFEKNGFKSFWKIGRKFLHLSSSSEEKGDDGGKVKNFGIVANGYEWNFRLKIIKWFVERVITKTRLNVKIYIFKVETLFGLTFEGRNAKKGQFRGTY